MLGQIERGQSSPTINTLWKISTGLKIPLSFFCRQQEAEFLMARLEDRELIMEEDGGMRAYPLFPFDPVRNVEIFYIEFDPGVKYSSEPHRNGVEEYIFVLDGKIAIEVGGEKICLDRNQALRFKADIAHAYYNPADSCSVVHEMIFYPDN